MLDKPEIVQSAACQTAVIRLNIPREEMRNVMGPAIQELMGAVAAQGVAPVGPLFSHHFKMDPEFFDFEVGVPVASTVSAVGRMQPGELPGRTVARTNYRGPYEELGSAWGEFGEWIEAAGHNSAPDLWECYVSGPETGQDPANWCTELNRPLITTEEAAA